MVLPVTTGGIALNKSHNTYTYRVAERGNHMLSLSILRPVADKMSYELHETDALKL